MNSKAIFITGTGTGVGKTLVCAGLAAALKNRGIDIGVMKPLATGALRRKNRLISPDAAFLKKASGIEDDLSLINPYSSKFALAPEIAFRKEGRRISPAKIIDCFNSLLRKHQLLLIEGIGGLLVPICPDYLIVDLIRDLDVGLIIVSRNCLGTINHTLLTIRQAQDYGCDILGVVFNRISQDKNDISQKTNPEIVRKICKVDILGEIPYVRNISVVKDKFQELAEIINKNINLDSILKKINNEQQDFNYKDLARFDKKYVWHPFTQMRDWQRENPLIIEEAKGAYLKDIRGNWFLDGVSSLWVNIHGHRRQEIDCAIKKQLNKVAHSTLLGLANVPSIKLAQELIKIAAKGLTKVFYSDNGSTSVEVALKMSFQYWQHKGKKQKTKFIYLENSYHGDTLGSVSVGGIDLFHKIFHPLLFNSFKVDSPYCYRCPKDMVYPSCRFACLEKLKQVLEKNHNRIAALIIEPIVQCAGGMIVWPKGILSQMRKLCDKYNVLLIADEVAVGFGRTGKMFACEQEKVSPDLLCLSKGLSAGYLPLAATLVKEKIYNAFLADYSDKKTFFHGHSYTGNPLSCSAALASLEIFKKEKTLQKLQPKIKFLKQQLLRFNDLSYVGDIRQKGLIVGIELVKNKTTKEPFTWQDKIAIKVCQEVRKYGVILRPLGNVIVLMPPLVITKNEIKKLLDTTFKAIKEVTEDYPE